MNDSSSSSSSDEGALVIGHSKDASLHTFEIHLSKFNTLKQQDNDDNDRMGTFFLRNVFRSFIVHFTQISLFVCVIYICDSKISTCKSLSLSSFHSESC